METQTGVRIKIVEKTGVKLENLLHKSNPWQGEDCQRDGCLLCLTKRETGKFLDQDCTKRCITYETWCITCERREQKRIDEEHPEEDEKARMKRYQQIRLFKYIGESSRSIYERGLEHLRDLEELKTDSHMLKHFCEMHTGEEIKDMKFGCRILKQSQTAFNRQINESVEIQSNNFHYILNSKSEYNRCALPRLSAKL